METRVNCKTSHQKNSVLLLKGTVCYLVIWKCDLVSNIWERKKCFYHYFEYKYFLTLLLISNNLNCIICLDFDSLLQSLLVEKEFSFKSVNTRCCSLLDAPDRWTLPCILLDSVRAISNWNSASVLKQYLGSKILLLLKRYSSCDLKTALFN